MSGNKKPINLNWLEDYQQFLDSLHASDHKACDSKLLYYLKAYHQYPNGSKEQKRFFSRLMETLLVTASLRIGDSYEEQEAMGKTYDWLCKDILVLTPVLLSTCEKYCQSNTNSRSKQLYRHLNIIQTYNLNKLDLTSDESAAKKYREAEKNLRLNIENILQEIKSEDRRAKSFFEPVIWREPRLKLFICYPPLRISESLAKWVNSYLQRRKKDTEVKRKKEVGSLRNPDELPETKLSGDFLVEQIPMKGGSLKGFPKYNQISKTDFMLYVLAEREEICTLRNALTSSNSIPVLDYSLTAESPECTRRILAQRLLLQDPPDKLEEIAQNYGIPFKILYQALPTFFEVIEHLYTDLEIESYPPWRTNPHLRHDLLRGYILADPDDWLVKPIKKDFPNLTWQIIAQWLCLQEVKVSIADIAREFNISARQLAQLINGAGKRSGLLDRLAGRLIEYYPQPSRLRKAVLTDSQHLLRNCHVTNHSYCNAQFLAQRRLKILGSVQSFETIAEELTQQGSRLKPNQIENHWHGKCLHRIGRVIRNLDKSSRGKSYE